MQMKNRENQQTVAALHTHTHTHTFVLTNSFFKGNPFHSGNGCNHGISLIALIITIIVIIILAAISIAGVSGVVERSRYAKFCGDLDAMQDAVSQAYGNELVNQALKNPTNRKSSEEIYAIVAGGSQKEDNQDLVEIADGNKLGMKLPKYGDSKWYVDVSSGEVYLLDGFEYNGKLYSSKADIQKGEGRNPQETVDTYAQFHEVITVDVPSGAIPVVYDEEAKSWKRADENSHWYDYRESEKQWANIVTVKSGSYAVGETIPEEDIIGMFVYIPRYAYQITSGYHSNVTGTIDIKFVKKVDGKNIDQEGEEYSEDYPTIEGDKMTDFVVHPVFIADEAKGGWDKDLNGIWVAKFESSSSSTEIVDDTAEYITKKAKGSDGQAIKVIATGNGKTSTNMGEKYGSSGNGSDYVTIRPNVTAWRNIDIPHIIIACQNVSSAHDLKGSDTHMMKNTEWGAVAYLAQSQYGNQHIWINPYTEGEVYNASGNGYNMWQYCSTLTGMVGLRYNEDNKKLEKNGENTLTYYYSEKIEKAYNEEDGSITIKYQKINSDATLGTTYSNTYYRYNTANGVHGSTTDNVYGIYDMSGGAWEYVAAYVNNEGTNATTNCSKITKDKYGNVYEKGTDDTADANYTANNTYYGDAVWEISNGGNDASNAAWNGDNSSFPFGGDPAFNRGGGFDITSYAGSFLFFHNSGGVNGRFGFRVVLVAE